MPITKINAERAPDMLVAARRLGVVPFLEMYVVTGRSDDVIAESLTFTETDAVLEEMSALDRRLGFDTSVEWGQRIIGRPPCVRPKYTFTVLPDHSLMACPASQLVLGNCADSSIRASIETEDLKRHVLSEGLCPCSTYAGMDANNIPVWLPPELIKLIDRTDEWLSA